jgi:UDP-glucose 4-epimerase
MSSETILVTGGAGFIGSHLCEALLKEGHQVRVLDDLSVGHRENVPKECEFIQGSVLQESILEKALRSVTVIFHEAARVTIRGSVDQFESDAETNLMGTLRVMRQAGKASVRRFVYASSMAVYSDSEKPIPVSEHHPTDPVSPYGIAKLAAEQYVLMVCKELGMEPVVLRYFNTFGTRQAFTPYVGVITIFITRLLQNQGIVIFGDGKQTRDFVHVSDIVQANLLALKSQSASGKIMNVGSGRGTTVLQVAQLLKEKIFPEANITFEPARPEELRNSIADISEAVRILGYHPRTHLDSQINEVIDSLRK